MPVVNINNYIECTISEGPGKRFVIWFQGCFKRCKGCCNQELLKVVDKELIEIEELCKKIKKSSEENKIEGVTFLGGEPILQIYSLLDIAEYCKKIGLTTMVFSGYYKNEIFSIFPQLIDRFEKSIDILIDGPFEIDKLDNKRKWIGSKNQNIHFFSEIYNIKDFLEDYKKSIEIRIDDNTIRINGWPIEISKN